MRDGLSDMIQDAVGGCAKNWADIIADHLLSEGVIVPPCKVGTTLYFLYDSPYADKPDLTPRIYETNEWYFDVDGKGVSIKPRWVYGYKGEYHYYLGKTVFLTREEAEKVLALAGRMKLLKPEKWQRIPLSECHLYECCCNCTEFSCSGMSAPDGYCREHSKVTDATKHCKKFKERT